MSIIHLEDVKSILLDLKREELIDLKVISNDSSVKKVAKLLVKYSKRHTTLSATIEYLDEKIKERDKLYKTKTK